LKFLSSRGGSAAPTEAEAIAWGLAPDGGLFVPETFPEVSREERLAMAGETYPERAMRILSRLMDTFPKDGLRAAIDAAYAAFPGSNAAPVIRLDDKLSVMELWHGPTCAFKDVALQLLPRLLRLSHEQMSGDAKETLILTATSGDTGKAALEGFANVPGVKILVYYPAEGVSPLQKLQMTTQKGENVGVFGVDGVFDDAQTGVKRIFSNPEMNKRLYEAGVVLSSANSINFGRLAPQVVYYFSAWCDLYASGAIGPDEAVDFVVPTGNFGDILAGEYARRMGLPVGRLICASNRNRVLTDFFRGGVYDAKRPFFTTSSPSMDILVSSNLERLLFEAVGRNGAKVAHWMAELNGKGSYAPEPEVMERLRQGFDAGCADESETAQAIREVFESRRYVMDPHTAVGYHVYRELGDPARQTVLVSTASPYKFLGDVLPALTGRATEGEDPFLWMEQLEKLSGLPVPEPLAALSGKTPRFTKVIDKGEMEASVLSFLGLEN